MRESVFGHIDGQAVRELWLDNGIISCSVLTYGCTLRTLAVPDRNGNKADVVLGYDSIDQYASVSGRLGATIGRYANRIKGARFPLGGEMVQLSVNRPPNHIHGGFKGFDKRIWDVLDHAEDSLTLGYTSSDGEEGYPGKLETKVSFSLSGSSMSIRYWAVSDKDTVCNLTNHSYFDLSGGLGVGGHSVRIRSDSYIDADADGIPTGNIENVAGAMDLRDWTPMGAGQAYDVCYLLGFKGECALCRSDSTGIQMSVLTDMPAMQFYTGDGLKEVGGKGGRRISARSGLCFETQYAPDTPNNPAFGDCTLRKGEEYSSETVFSFSTF